MRLYFKRFLGTTAIFLSVYFLCYSLSLFLLFHSHSNVRFNNKGEFIAHSHFFSLQKEGRQQDAPGHHHNSNSDDQDYLLSFYNEIHPDDHHHHGSEHAERNISQDQNPYGLRTTTATNPHFRNFSGAPPDTWPVPAKQPENIHGKAVQREPENLKTVCDQISLSNRLNLPPPAGYSAVSA